MDIKKGQTLKVIYKNKKVHDLEAFGYISRQTVVETVTVKRVARYKKTGQTRVAVSNGRYGFTIINPKLDSDGNIVINCK